MLDPVDPIARRAVVFRSNGETEVLEGTGVVSARPALPDLSIDVASLFDGL